MIMPNFLSALTAAQHWGDIFVEVTVFVAWFQTKMVIVNLGSFAEVVSSPKHHLIVICTGFYHVFYYPSYFFISFCSSSWWSSSLIYSVTTFSTPANILWYLICSWRPFLDLAYVARVWKKKVLAVLKKNLFLPLSSSSTLDSTTFRNGRQRGLLKYQG